MYEYYSFVYFIFIFKFIIFIEDIFMMFAVLYILVYGKRVYTYRYLKCYHFENLYNTYNINIIPE